MLICCRCVRWRGTQETPSSASCTQHCHSPAPKILRYPAPLPHLAMLHCHPLPMPQKLCGTSPNPDSLPCPQIFKHETIAAKQWGQILLCFYYYYYFYHLLNSEPFFNTILFFYTFVLYICGDYGLVMQLIIPMSSEQNTAQLNNNHALPPR